MWDDDFGDYIDGDGNEATFHEYTLMDARDQQVHLEDLIKQYPYTLPALREIVDRELVRETDVELDKHTDELFRWVLDAV